MNEAENSDESTRQRTEVQSQAAESGEASASSASSLSQGSNSPSSPGSEQVDSASSGVSGEVSAGEGAAGSAGGTIPERSQRESGKPEGTGSDSKASEPKGDSRAENSRITASPLRARERYMRKIGKIKD